MILQEANLLALYRECFKVSLKDLQLVANIMERHLHFTSHKHVVYDSEDDNDATV